MSSSSVRRRTWKTIGITTGIYLLLTLVVVFGNKLFVVQTEFGPCNRITGSCRDVPSGTVGMIAGYSWPEDTTVISSYTTLPVLGSKSYFYATLRLGTNEAPISMGNGYTYPSGLPGTDDIGPKVVPHYAGQQFRDEGAKDVKVMRKRDGLVVLSGTRNGERLVFVSAALTNL